MSAVSEAVVARGVPSLQLSNSELIYRPIEVGESNEELDAQVSELVEALEGDEDTLRVWTSLDSH